MKHIYIFAIIIVSYIMTASCGVSYKFNNANLDYNIYKTIAIAEFPNRAALVYPPLAQEFNQKLKDAYSRQTRLSILSQSGDYNIEGEIDNYSLQQLAVGGDGLSAQTRLVMSVRVRFTNTKNPKDDFDRTFTAQRDFPSTTTFESVQSQLATELTDEIIDQIFNATVASW